MALFSFLKSDRAGWLLVSTLALAQRCRAGYQIQDDCSDVQRNFLDTAFQSANTLSFFARSNTNQGFNSDGSKVFEWLYGTEDRENMQTSVQMALDGIIANTAPVEGDPQGGDSTTADVRVFCSLNRLREGSPGADGERRIFDSVTKEFLKAKLDCATALAWVIQPDDEDADQPDTMQICPWFLDYAMQQNAQFQGQFTPTKLAKMIINLKLDRLVTWVKYTPIDLFQLFDKVVVHELAHTRRGQSAEDIGGASGYGWKNCRKLSTERGENAPHRNADTVALFASISGLINSGGMVNEDGTFTHGEAAGGNDAGGDAQADAGGDQQEDAGQVAKRTAVIPRTILGRLAPRFDAASLKGRPLF